MGAAEGPLRFELKRVEKKTTGCVLTFQYPEIISAASPQVRDRITPEYWVSLPASSSTGSAQLIAANGDMIFTTIVGQAEPVRDTPGLLRIVEINTITGGTGRFAGAKGSFTMERLADTTTGLTFRFVPRDDYFPGCSALTTSRKSIVSGSGAPTTQC